MKKYILGLTAVICAIAFSAFTKPLSQTQFKLTQDPVVANVVNNPTLWSDFAPSSYGRCDQTPVDIACKISLDQSAKMSKYSHINGSGDLILNDETFAKAQSPKLDYVVITEVVGASPDRIINAITFFHFDATANGGLGAYVDVTGSLTQGATGDYDFLNARD